MYNKFYSSSETGEGTAFRDVLFGLVGVLAAVMVILLLLPKNPDVASDATARARGNIRVEIVWPDDMDVDIDLIGQAPNQRAVGYFNKNGIVLSLVKDDLGSVADISNLNYEIMFSRGLPAGEWIFNIHWYGNAGNLRAVPVDVIITIMYDDTSGSKDRPKQIISTTLTLSRVGQERTIIRFTLDAEGKLIPDSFNSVFKPIRAAARE